MFGRNLDAILLDHLLHFDPQVVAVVLMEQFPSRLDSAALNPPGSDCPRPAFAYLQYNKYISNQLKINI